MPTFYRYLIPGMWACWWVYWWVSSRTAKATARNESLSSRLTYLLPLVASIYLLVARDVPIEILNARFVPRTGWTFGVGSSLTGLGLLFTVWARRHIGTNWSATVTIKQGHELVTTGPYAIVRHPIYTGLLLAVIGTALAIAEWRAILAIALALVSFVRKLRVEERWMREQFGERYRAYSQRTDALVPFVW